MGAVFARGFWGSRFGWWGPQWLVGCGDVVGGSLFGEFGDGVSVELCSPGVVVSFRRVSKLWVRFSVALDPLLALPLVFWNRSV